VDVRIVRAGSTVTIDVLDDGAGTGSDPAWGSGQGLAGMAERARIYSGTVEAGRKGQGWSVRAVLAWPGDQEDELPSAVTSGVPEPAEQLQGRK
jgi:signal transduction histidine kinase